VVIIFLFNSPIELFILTVLSKSCHSQCSYPRAVDQPVFRVFGRTHKFPACLVAVAKMCFQKSTIGFLERKKLSVLEQIFRLPTISKEP